MLAASQPSQYCGLSCSARGVIAATRPHRHDHREGGGVAPAEWGAERGVERRFEVFPTVIDLTEGVGWLSIGFPERRRPRSPRASCHSCAAPRLQATSR